MRLVTLQLYTYWYMYNTATGAGLLNAGKSLETWTNASKPWASLPHSRNTCCNSICIAQKDGLLDAFTFQDYNWKWQQVDVCTVTRSSTRARTAIAHSLQLVGQSCIYSKLLITRGTMLINGFATSHVGVYVVVPPLAVFMNNLYMYNMHTCTHTCMI